MASYYWNHINSPDELNIHAVGMAPKLYQRAKDLLKDGHPFEIGEMWYGGKFHHRIRYTPRTDYAVNGELYINTTKADSRYPEYWVMDRLGSVHNTPFLSLDAAERYMEVRKHETARPIAPVTSETLRKLRRGIPTL